MTDEERSRRNATIRVLLNRLDQHCPGEADHARRVAVVAVAIGQQLGLDDEALLNLRYAAELHDIGKLAVSPGLLTAPRPLEAEERSQIEKHVILAGTYLAEPFLDGARAGIEAHHERWDGSGYPTRSIGAAIPLVARIIAIAEAFDMMQYPPLWRTPFSVEAASSAILGLSGQWFDPQVCEAFETIQPLIQP